MSKKVINDEVQKANSNLFVVIHEVSRTNKELAMKLDHLIADVREASYRSGQYDGLGLAQDIIKRSNS